MVTVDLQKSESELLRLIQVALRQQAAEIEKLKAAAQPSEGEAR